jgi:predicted transcriptional regulator
MTIKEIAELCGVTEQTVLNWAHKLEVLNQNIWLRISEKLDRGSPEHPSDYDLGETLEIIGEGGKNKALASLLAENAATKNALTVQNEATAKLREQLEMLRSLPEQFEKFKGYAVEAYKKLEARVDGAYKEVLGKATERAGELATADVMEYLLSSHKPSAHEAQLADLKRYLSRTIAATGDRRDKIDFFRLYPEYELKVENPIPKDAFAAHVLLLYPQITFKGGVFSGCHFDY